MHSFELSIIKLRNHIYRSLVNVGICSLLLLTQDCSHLNEKWQAIIFRENVFMSVPLTRVECLYCNNMMSVKVVSFKSNVNFSSCDLPLSVGIETRCIKFVWSRYKSHLAWSIHLITQICYFWCGNMDSAGWRTSCFEIIHVLSEQMGISVVRVPGRMYLGRVSRFTTRHTGQMKWCRVKAIYHIPPKVEKAPSLDSLPPTWTTNKMVFVWFCLDFYFLIPSRYLIRKETRLIKYRRN